MFVALPVIDTTIVSRKMHKTFCIGVDLTGADAPATALLPAIERLLQEYEGALRIKIFWPNDLPVPSHLTDIETVPDSLAEEALIAWKIRPHSAIPLGLEALHEGKIEAFLTCGNTGALVSAATVHIPRLPGIQRIALAATLPTLIPYKKFLLMDCGATLEPTAEQLVQFAEMAVEARRAQGYEGLLRIGLLNVGTEPHKGTSAMRGAYTLLQHESQLACIGNVEPYHVLQGAADIVICPGLVGNIFLKTLEAMWPHPWPRGGVAQLLGLEKPVFKVHGHVGADAFKEGIQEALIHLFQNRVA